ncbi:ArnT family glycosyltransferase [Neptunomonas antarctica]|uniref:Dolichyl-phosphate-mannose-protein mannosyltransferase n=1 Tax=Neptunomonas antarctica TaxID=619304 RepID=A0A1N7K8Q4_9GAMM|nr:glycosyltransferase family 39 protein [Neptunomonas antarctica]SIS57940.1 Dolichyl-phosphate-mannose-protein mannosyltransferase [Neptunomonas antarctica]
MSASPHKTSLSNQTGLSNKSAWLLSWQGVTFFILLLTLYRILAITQGHVSLFYDEAYYYHWSLDPDWGYYSKPPMVAWIITMTTSLFSDNDFAVKLGAPILYGLTAGVVYRIGKHLWNPQAAACSALVFCAAPLVGFNSLFITTDAPLLFFWALATWLFIIALQTQSWKNWLLVGVAVGLGMMSKYTMALLPIGLFLYMGASKQYRPLLLTLKPWSAAVVAGLIFALNIYWNYQHNFVTLNHTSEISQLDKKLFNPDKLAEFILSQLIVFGPIWSYFLIRQWMSKEARAAITQSGILLATFLPLFLIICTQALLSRAFINWAAPCLIAASLWTGFYLSRQPRRKLIIGLIIQLGFISTFYHWPIILESAGIERTRKVDPFQRTQGWSELATQLKPVLMASPNALITSPSRKLLAYISFYAEPGQLRVARWNPDQNNIRDYYDLLFNLRNYAHQNQQAFILINETPLDSNLLSRFQQCGSEQHYTETVFRDLSREIYLYECTGFKGYINEGP